MSGNSYSWAFLLELTEELVYSHDSNCYNAICQESLYFTIDQETGERIPRQSAGPYQPPAEFTEDTDLSKELAELGELTNWDYEEPVPEQQQIPDYHTVQQQPVKDNFNDIIIQTDDKPNPFSGGDFVCFIMCINK